MLCVHVHVYITTVHVHVIMSYNEFMEYLILCLLLLEWLAEVFVCVGGWIA